MNVFIRIGIVLISILATLSGAELILRLGGWGPEAVKEHARLLRYDSTLGWTKIANGSVVYRWVGSRIHETSNSFGSRGSEIDPAKSTGHRVVFLGDSFCEGYLVGDDSVFSAVLAKRQPALEVINLGVAGYSTDQELLLYERVAPQLNPQRVILLFFDNDVWFNSVSQEYRARKPLFEMTEGELKLTGIPVPRPDPSVAAAPCADCPSSIRLVQLVERAKLGLFHPPQGASSAPAIAPEMQIWHRTEMPEIENAWRITEALLGRLRRSTGDRLTIFYVPTTAAVYDDSWQQTKRAYGMDDQWDIGLSERRLAEICSRLNIPMISPTSRFRERARRGEILYFMQDGHWNSEGHRLAAEMLAEPLSQ